MPGLTRRRLLTLLAGLFLLAILLPLVININRFHRQFRRTLEGEFGRRVSLGRMTLRLLPRLGVDAEYVTVEEDPAFGAEPFIRSEKISCDVNPWSLWRGRLEFSQLAFTRPSINLVKNAAGRWNLAAFLEPASPGNPARGEPSAPMARAGFSSLVLEDARFNFKVRDEKKVYGLVDTDAHLEHAEGGRWQLELEGTPFRTDRALTEAGTVRLKGALGPLRSAYSDLPLQLDLVVGKAQLADLLVLFFGAEYGVLGRVEARTHFEGTPHELHLEGTARVADVHRWDMLAPPRAPTWQLRYRLAIHSQTGEVDVEELECETQASRIHAAGRWLPWSTPRQWEIRFAPFELALMDLWGIYAAFEKAADQTAEVLGATGGALTWFGPDHRLQGSLDWQGVAIKTKSLAAGAEAARFRTEFTRDGAFLKSLSVLFRSPRAPAGAGESMSLAGRWSRRSNASLLEVQLVSRGVRLEQLTALSRAVGWDFAGGANLNGNASFAVEYRGSLRPKINLARRGWAELRDAQLGSPWLNEPMAIKHARIEFAGRRTRVAPLAAVIAGARIAGNLALMTERTPTCEFRLDADQLDAARLDLLLNPRRRSGLPLAAPRPGAGGAPAPGSDLFSEWNARGQFHVGRFSVNWMVLENLRAQANYSARHMRLEKLLFDVHGGKFAGEAQLDLVNPPGFRLSGQLDRVRLGPLLEAAGQQAARYTGVLSARGQLETTGTEKRQLMENLAGRGAFILEEGKFARFNLLAAMARATGTVPAAAFDPDTEVHSLSGEFFVAEKRVRLKNALLVVAGASASLEGAADIEGRLSLVLQAEPLSPSGATWSPAWPVEIFENRFRLLGTLRDPEVRLAQPTRPRR